MPKMIYVGMGGNVGDVPATFARAIEMLSGVVRMSSLWRTAPVGAVSAQPWFLNACVEVQREDEPLAFLHELQRIERELGRDRSREVPGGPRPIDLDWLLWDERELDGLGLRVPHPRLAERAFALAPLVELAGAHLMIPGAGRAGALLAGVLAKQEIERL